MNKSTALFFLLLVASTQARVFLATNGTDDNTGDDNTGGGFTKDELMRDLDAFFQKYAYIVGAFWLLIGVLLGFFGLVFTNIAVFLLSFFATAWYTYLGVFNLVTNYTSFENETYIAGGVSLAVAVLVAVLTCKYKKLGPFMIGAAGGCVLVFVSMPLLLQIEGDKQLITSLSFIVAGVVFGIISIYTFAHVTIIASSGCGAYFIARGASFYIGGWMEIGEMIRLIKDDKFSTISDTAWAYMGATIGVFILCILFQYAQKKKRDQNEEFNKREGELKQHLLAE